MKHAFPLAFAVLLAGCSTSTTELKGNPKTVKIETQLDRNYQAAYKDLTTTATRCQSSVGIYAATMVDSELYSELELGEVTYWLSNFGTRNFYWKAEIRKISDNSSHLTVWSGNTVSNENMANKVVLWAQGDQGCKLTST